MGISIDKEFIPSVANVIGTDLRRYKLISKGIFACNPMHVGRDERLPIALYKKDNLALVSPAYFTFKVNNANILSNDYLMLWFRRASFDHICWLRSDSTVRGGVIWDDICSIEFDCPSIEKQNEIVWYHQTIANRIKLLEKINDNLEAQLESIFINLFSTSINENKSGAKLKDLVKIIDNRGKTPPLSKGLTDYPIIDVKALFGINRIIDYCNCTKYVDKETYDNWFRSGHPKKYDILMSTVGSIGQIKLFYGNKGCIAQNVVALRPQNIGIGLYVFQYLKFIQKTIETYNIGSVQPSIKITQFVEKEIYIPQEQQIKSFEELSKPISEELYLLAKENEMLSNLCNAILPKLLSGEIEL